MAGPTLNVLNFFFLAVNVAISHGFLASVAVYAVQSPFAAGVLGNGLVIIVLPVSRLVLALVESHLAQVIVAAVVASIALGIGNRQGETVYGLLAVPASGGGMAGGTAGKAVVL